MGTIWVREFTGGLDTRKMPETTAGGVLVKAHNGHITRGGEFEKRAAFVPEYSVAGTVGMFYTRAGVVVFGHEASPTPAVPAGVTYQQLEHPDTPSTALTRVLSADLYKGLIYAVAEFADGGVYHYYDGAQVTDWFDGRARATFEVTAGAVTAAVAATGSFDVTGGTAGPTNTITVAVNGVSILTTPVAWATSNAATATAIASAINSLTSSPDYTAAAVGATVTITAAVTGTAANGLTVVPTVAGNATVGNIVNMGGGAVAVTSTLSNLTVDGVSIIGSAVVWATSNENTASLIADEINSHVSVPDYTATVNGAFVSIVADDPGTASNGLEVLFTVVHGLTVDPTTLALAGGAADPGGTYQPGSFVATIGQKVYSVAGPNLHFSGIEAPTVFTTDATGAGFIDMSSYSSGSEDLVAVGEYQNYIAVFAAQLIQTWYVDPDPSLNRKVQLLKNTGTASRKSVTPFGDTDLFYLHTSGCRSLKARDSSNAASTTDIGVPVDTDIIAQMETLTATELAEVTGLIEPSSGRFWLVMKDKAFIFSLFPGARVSAWSTYDLSTEAGALAVTDAMVFDGKVYLRSGDEIYVYGGLNADVEYDATVAELRLPYLDAGRPALVKNYTGLDAACEGTWAIYAASDTRDDAAEEIAARVFRTTYPDNRVPYEHSATHLQLRCRSEGSTAAKLGALIIHYVGDQIEN